jgi:glutaminase
MSSKRAMRQAQKQAYAKHRSNISNSRFEIKKKFLTKNKDEKKNKRLALLIKFFFFLHVEIFEILSTSFKTALINMSCLSFSNKI